MPKTKNHKKTGANAPTHGFVVADQQGEAIKRLRKENDKLKASLMAVQSQAGQKHILYDPLVWVARRTDEEQRKWAPNFYKDLRKKIGKDSYEEFKREESKLRKPGSGDFYHGFNSGCLAMSRLFLVLSSAQDEKHEDFEESFVMTADQQREDAIAAFPALDT